MFLFYFRDTPYQFPKHSSQELRCWIYRTNFKAPLSRTDVLNSDSVQFVPLLVMSSPEYVNMKNAIYTHISIGDEEVEDEGIDHYP